MKNNLKFFTALALLLFGFASAQVGIGTTTPAPSALLDLTATNKALLLPRIANVNLITNPVNGMIVHDISSNCIRAFENGVWSICFNTRDSSNGSGVVSSYICNTASEGTLTVGSAVSGVTQTITANVSTMGTYIISTTANGVTFAASGTFAGTGNQNIVLTATGTPTAIGSNTFTLDTAPNCNFSRTTVANVSTNGSGVVSAYTCDTASTGTLTAGSPVSGVTQTITANVTTVGTYIISTTSNGITFAASGTFAGTGNQNIVLTATGTPTAEGSNTFTLNTAPNCNFSRTTIHPSTNGTGVVSAYNCNTASAGTLTEGTPVSGVAQTITATVTTVGTYNITTSANGVTFAGSGTFAGTGDQNILLTATGTPAAEGNSTFILNTAPNCNFSRTTIHPSTNGTAVVSAYTCTTASAGTLTAGLPVSGVTQTITATVTTLGTYNISTTANGVTFAANGTFAGLGDQNIVLTATGTPIAAGSDSFTINTTPNCNFSRSINSASSNGTSVVTAYDCTTASAGSLKVGNAVSGVTQTITATVTNVGTYDISTVANGVTFAASGTFAGTGAQNIVLTATGTPVDGGYINYILNTTPNCSFIRPTAGLNDVVSATGKIWMNKNLGATQVATSSTDALAYGDLYQWGRGTDGHQIRTSGTTGSQSNSDTPGHGDYITGNLDWRSPGNDNLWQGENGINNPCPAGYRVPTEAEFIAERLLFTPQNQEGAFNSVLKLTRSGNRNSGGGLLNVNQNSYYWTSTIFSSGAMFLAVENNGSATTPTLRAQGFAVRCIRN